MLLMSCFAVFGYTHFLSLLVVSSLFCFDLVLSSSLSFMISLGFVLSMFDSSLLTVTVLPPLLFGMPLILV